MGVSRETALERRVKTARRRSRVIGRRSDGQCVCLDRVDHHASLLYCSAAGRTYTQSLRSIGAAAAAAVAAGLLCVTTSFVCSLDELVSAHDAADVGGSQDLLRLLTSPVC